MGLILTNVSTIQDKSNLYMEVIKIIIPAIVSILGFIVTIITLSKSFKNEVRKQKSNVNLEKMSKIPYEVLILLDKLISADDPDSLLGDMTALLNTIYAYGTKEAIKIISLMQKENYEAGGDKQKLNQYRIIALYILLATQIKYDITGVIVSPKLWFQMKISDYSAADNKIKQANNKLVKELGLNSRMKIK